MLAGLLAGSTVTGVLLAFSCRTPAAPGITRKNSSNRERPMAKAPLLTEPPWLVIRWRPLQGYRRSLTHILIKLMAIIGLL
jgi:hypothetical protein